MVAAGTGLAVAGGLTAAPRAARAQASTTLSLWTGYPELIPYYDAVAQAYKASHPDVSVTTFGTSLREAEQKLSAAVPTGTGPDIFDIGTNITVNFIDAGLIEPNDPAIDQYLKSKAWSPQLVDFFSSGGKSYGLPLLVSTAALYYNKTMFKEAGIAQPPATFPEMLDAAKKLTKTDASGRMTRSGISLRLSGQGSGIAEKFRFVLEPAGGSLIVKTPSGKWHNGFDNDAGRAALQFYVDCVQKDKVDDPKIQHDAAAFESATTAMLFREAWVIGEIQEKNPSLDYGVVPIPSWRAGEPHKMLLQPWGIYVNGRSSNQQAAWDFLRFLTSPENAFRLTSMTGWVSARQDVDWGPLLQKVPQFEVFVRPPKDVVYYVEPILPVWDEIESKMADRLTAAYVDPSLNGNPAKVAQSIHEMAAETDGILKEADLYGTT
jgi:multiple sugar transport system substrate-binding protein